MTPTRTRLAPRFLRAGAILLSIGASTALSGCYQRVVSAQGIGASSLGVNKSARSDTALDRWFDRNFGDPPPDPSRVRTVSVPPISSGGSWQRSAATSSR